MTPDQHHPKYIAMIREGPISLLSSICVIGGPHPCLDRLLDHPRCLDILERLLSFISRCPDAMTTPQFISHEDWAKLSERTPCFSLAGVAQSPLACLFCSMILIKIVIIINLLLPVQQNRFSHLRVLLVLHDRGISAQSN